MKIALVTDAWFPQINGVVTTLNHCKEYLESIGHEFLVIHPALFINYPMPKYPSIRLAWMPGRKLKKMLRDFDADAIHISTEGPLGRAASGYLHRKKIPFTTSYHTQFPQYVKKYCGLPESISYAWMRRFHKRAVRTLVPTPSVKRELDGQNFQNIHVWTRGVDHETFFPEDQEPIVDMDKPIFLYMGRVAAEKNIEAFLSLDLPGSMLVVGDGPIRNRLEAQYPHAIFVGFKRGRELARYIAAADVMAFPSRTDTFGVVMLEAMACGTPVAAYPVTGPIDVIKDGEVGALNEDLKQACLDCLKIESQDCIDYAGTFTWQRTAEMFFDNLEPVRDLKEDHPNPAEASKANAESDDDQLVAA